MAYPTAYELSYDFTAFQSGSPTTPLPADKIEIEYNNISTTTDQLITAVTAITNSDGSVKNASIGNAQLKSEVTIGVNAATTWLTATAYVVHDTVYQGNNVYRCLVAHTSGVFATDLAASKWSLVLDFNTYLASASASASTATTQATTATTQAGIATAQAVIATTKASEANASAIAAAASAASLSSVLSLTEQGSTPATPATGISKFYLKTDSNAYVLDDAGNEKVLLKNSAYVANRRGNLFVQNANDDGLEALSQGTSGQVLTSAGADALPTWGDALISIANGGTGQTTAAAGFDALKQAATTSYTGVVELATSSEAQGSSSSVVLTPSSIASNMSFGTNGYVLLPGGLILQYGIVTTTSSLTSVSFPVTFPNAARAVFAQPVDANFNAAAENAHPHSITTSGFSVAGYLNNTGSVCGDVNWYAIGN